MHPAHQKVCSNAADRWGTHVCLCVQPGHNCGNKGASGACSLRVPLGLQSSHIHPEASWEPATCLSLISPAGVSRDASSIAVGPCKSLQVESSGARVKCTPKLSGGGLHPVLYKAYSLVSPEPPWHHRPKISSRCHRGVGEA